MENYISINPNFFNSGYIQFELEHPNEGSQDIEFTNKRNNAFYIYLKIVDIEDEQTQDRALAPLSINDETVKYGHNIGSMTSMRSEKQLNK